MADAGSAMMGVGTASGENRAAEAAKMAISSPLMEESIEGATGMLLNFTGSEDLNLFEVNEAADIVVSTADKGANIIFGTVIDPTIGDEVRVTVIATGFEGFETLARRPMQVARAQPPPPGRRPRRPRAPRAHRSPTTTSTSRRSCAAAEPPARGDSLGAVEASAALRRTPLYDAHVAAGAKLVPFAGWEMPVQYEGVRAEHLAVRTAAASSTSRTWARSRPPGRGRSTLLQRLLSNDVAKIEVGGAQYSVLCRDDGGVLDDLFTYRLADDRYLTVTNAANHERDLAWFREHAADFDAEVARPPRRLRDARGPGPGRARRSSPALVDGELPPRMRTAADAARARRRRGARLRHRLHGRGRGRDPDRARRARRRSGTRCSTPARRPPASAPATRCGSRSAFTSTATTSAPTATRSRPASAGAARRRPGSSAPRPSPRRAPTGTAEKLAPFALTERGIPRQGNAVLAGGEPAGEVTSGTLSPSLERGIGMAYVRAELAEPGTEVEIDVRGRRRAGADRVQAPLRPASDRSADVA